MPKQPLSFELLLQLLMTALKEVASGVPQILSLKQQQTQNIFKEKSKRVKGNIKIIDI